MSLKIDMNMIGPLKSHGSVAPTNVRISLLIWSAVWPENMCQWNCTGLPVISCLSMNVDESQISDSFIAHV